MNEQSSGSEPILCAHLLREVDQKLLELLGSLAPSEWELQTISPLWKVRDVAAHLLDTALRKLSMVRDGCYAEPVDIHSPEDLVNRVNNLNQEGARVYRRLSPRVLIDMMGIACEQSAHFHESLDPYAPATSAVSWAGEEISLNWFDTARELTERWHHQQQIRLATNRPGLLVPHLYHPVLECFVRGLPHVYRDVVSPTGTTLLLEISGECGGRWFISRGPTRWDFVRQPAEDFVCRVTVPQELAWRLFTKGIDRGAARAQIEIEGNQELGEEVLHLTAIIG
jgi:uncharacterized protein (TIGR03083 family)